MITIAMIDNIAKRITAETTPVWRYDLNRITLKLREPAVLFGCGLRPPEFEHRNDADSGSLAFVLGKAWVAPRLLGVDAVAVSAGHFADGHVVCLGSAFDSAVTGGGQVAVPVRVGGYSALGCEDVDDVRLGVVREVHRRCDVLSPAIAAAVMQQDHRSALEGSTNPALVRSELRDGSRVPVAHVELLSFTCVLLSLGGDACCAGEMRRQELSGSVQRRGRFVEDPVIGLEDVGHPGGDVEGDLDVGGGGLPGEADGVVKENLVRSGLDDQGRQAGQLGEYGADEAESGILPRRIVGDSGVECWWAEQRVGLALGFHGRPGQGEVGIG